jgi:hypothetical protein
MYSSTANDIHYHGKIFILVEYRWSIEEDIAIYKYAPDLHNAFAGTIAEETSL